MIKPNVLEEDKDFVELIKAFDTPIGVIPDISAAPLIEVVAAAGFTFWARSRNPNRSLKEHMYSGLICMLVTLGSEWAHNMAHVIAARLIGKPADAVRIAFGTPLLYYRDLNDASVSPREHFIRSASGPVLNAILLPFGHFWRKYTRQDSLGRDAAEAFVSMNEIILIAGLQPMPGLDGGAMLKWALVDQGNTIPQADDIVRKTNWISSPLLIIGSILAFLKKKRLLGGFLSLLGAMSYLIARGFIKETES